MEKLFTYGSLQISSIQEKLFNRILVGTPDVLIGYEKGTIEIDGQIFGIANPKPQGKIEGMVYELTKEEIERADVYEGNEYQRLPLTLVSAVESWVYVRA